MIYLWPRKNTCTDQRLRLRLYSKFDRGEAELRTTDDTKKIDYDSHILKSLSLGGIHKKDHNTADLRRYGQYQLTLLVDLF